MGASISPAERSGRGGHRQETELVFCTARGCQVAVTFEVRGRFLKKRVRVLSCPVMYDGQHSCGQCCLFHSRS
jgi:hypothetical protein